MFRTWTRVALFTAILAGHAGTAAAQPASIYWRLDNLTRVGGHPVSVIGNPSVVETDLGPAVAFDGSNDGLLLDANPLAGLTRFTIEVVFQPAADGPEEQRFLHIEEPGGNRALIELRHVQPASWALDTYLRSGDDGLTLLDRNRLHQAGRWHVAALTYDGKTMSHYVGGRRELSGPLAFAPLSGGRTSIGVRQNRVSWFKGVIHSVRIVPDALTSDRLTGAILPLWPEGVPGAKPDGGDERLEDGRIYNVQRPAVIYVAPLAAAARTAVVICPGGSYGRLAVANEAEAIAQRLSRAGIASFILKYRLAEYGHPAPLQDVLRAIRMIRSRAREFDVAPDRIGVMGASAGGHVAASAGILFDTPAGRTGASLDTISGRPDFVGLLYPVITMAEPLAHADSRRNLLGPNPPAALVKRWSLEQQVHPDVPPTFIVHSSEDTSVPAEHSLRFYEAARRSKVAVELHLYERGPHGFGTRPDLGTTSGWFDGWLQWLRAHRFLPPDGGDAS